MLISPTSFNTVYSSSSSTGVNKFIYNPDSVKVRSFRPVSALDSVSISTSAVQTPLEIAKVFTEMAEIAHSEESSDALPELIKHKSTGEFLEQLSEHDKKMAEEREKIEEKEETEERLGIDEKSKQEEKLNKLEQLKSKMEELASIASTVRDGLSIRQQKGFHAYSGEFKKMSLLDMQVYGEMAKAAQTMIDKAA